MIHTERRGWWNPVRILFVEDLLEAFMPNSCTGECRYKRLIPLKI